MERSFHRLFNCVGSTIRQSNVYKHPIKDLIPTAQCLLRRKLSTSSKFVLYGVYARNGEVILASRLWRNQEACKNTRMGYAIRCLERRGEPSVRFFSSSGGRICWSCGTIQSQDSSSQVAQFFCSSCFKVLQVDNNATYFQIMNRAEDFDIDTNTLTTDYRKLQSSLHPDKFSQSSAMEQEHSAAQSSLVNKAYRTLLDPLARAVYMLDVNGYEIAEDNTSAEPDFLIEMFQINETLSECTCLEQLDEMDKDINASIDNTLMEASKAFRCGNYSSAKGLVVKLKYYYNIRNSIKDKRLVMK